MVKVMAGHCGAGSGVVRHTLARQGLSWRGPVAAGWCTAEQGFVLHGKVVSWLGEVLFCVVGFVGVLFSRVRSYCGVVWSVEALHSIVKFGPVMYSVVMYAEALFWQGGVVQNEVRHAKLSLRRGTVESGFARLRAVGQALVFFGIALLGKVRWCPVKFGVVGHGFHEYGGVIQK